MSMKSSIRILKATGWTQQQTQAEYWLKFTKGDRAAYVALTGCTRLRDSESLPIPPGTIVGGRFLTQAETPEQKATAVLRALADGPLTGAALRGVLGFPITAAVRALARRGLIRFPRMGRLEKPILDTKFALRVGGE